MSTEHDNPEYIAVAMVPPMEDDISHLSSNTMDDQNDDDENIDGDENDGNASRKADAVESSSNDSFDRLKCTASRIQLLPYDITSTLKACSRPRRRLIWQVIILVIIVILIIITSKRIQWSNDFNPTTQQEGEDDVVGSQPSSPSRPQGIENSDYILCNRGEYNLTLIEWMNQKDIDSHKLCDPLVS